MPRWFKRVARFVHNKYRKLRGRNQFTDPAVGMYYV